MVCKCLRWCYYDTITSMNTNRVKVFHVADYDTVIISITHNFVFDFFPACYTAFDENLTYHTVFKTTDNDFDEFFFIFRNTATCTTECISRANDDRITNLICKFYSRCYIINDCTFWNWFTDFLHCFFKQFTVFSSFDGFK